MKKNQHIFGAILLLVIGFLFLQCEFDLFSPEEHDHNSHDFCVVLNAARTENVTSQATNILNIDLDNFVLDVPKLTLSGIHKSIVNPQKIKADNNIHILCSSFLI